MRNKDKDRQTSQARREHYLAHGICPHCGRNDLQKAGAIRCLQTQVKFELLPARKYEGMPNERRIDYIADFVYVQDGVTVIEDSKGHKTKDYIIKRKLLKNKYCKDGKFVFKET